jgi:hypothetical protein
MSRREIARRLRVDEKTMRNDLVQFCTWHSSSRGVIGIPHNYRIVSTDRNEVCIMSGNSAMSAEEYARQLAALSYPKVEAVPGIPNAFRRRWVLRLGTILPAPEVLENTIKSFEASARRDIAKALCQPGDLEQPVPSASAIRLDDLHLVLEIDCPSPEAGMGDAAAIATGGILSCGPALAIGRP